MWSCDFAKQSTSSKLYQLVDENTSNLQFANNIQESDSLNYHNFPYIYMGGGVAVGDFNNDGLSDVYMTGNMVKNKLYLNKGGLVFEDISVAAGVEGDDRWYTGVSLTDINNDGFLDIYVSVSGKKNTRNQLYINNGDLTFTEKAAEYGIDDPSTSIQATFFDYDGDGDQDVFVANYPLVPLTAGNSFYAGLMRQNALKNSGHLYRNDGNSFVDVTAKAGVQNFGLTLGLSAADMNNDGWPDLYLSNDFNVPDYFYINNQDGTFKEVIKEATGHISMFGMGIDAADFNNDGLLDLIQADMTPEDYTRAKVNMASMSTASFWEGVNLGFHYQYMQNSLQLNNGIKENGVPVFSEMSRFAGVATTDWSWSTLFFDMDNDGFKDIYITNGMKRDVNDNDLNQRTSATSFKEAFTTKEINEYPSEPIDNYVFKNNGDLKFKKVTTAWGLGYKGFSNGMAYGDLDNDGDLDVLVNNLDQKMTLFENKSKNHYLRVKLMGSTKNPLGVGAKVTLKDVKTGNEQLEELRLTRGFQSSVEPIVHFGLGSIANEQLLTVVWSDGKQEEIKIKNVDRLITVLYENAKDEKSSASHKITTTYIAPKTLNLNTEYKHKEDLYDDYLYEPLLPHKYSTLGPAMAIGDINEDGLDDFYVGNARNSVGKLYEQTIEGDFIEIEGPWQQDEKFEDTGALFFDADADGDQDLYVVSGGNFNLHDKDTYLDRLYINTDEGFKASSLPKIATSGQVVKACDYDKDGDLDLFVGGRLSPGQYPLTPQSYLLRNDFSEKRTLSFTVENEQMDDSFAKMGMVTAAVWADIDGDSWQDLIVVGEWMPITIFKNKKGVLVDQTKEWGLHKNTGWWYGLEAFDVDNDGDLDLVAGNLGLNYKYKASPKKPFELFFNDFDQNGKYDIVLGVHKEGRLLPLRGRECSSQQIPAIKAKFGTYREFAAANLSDIYGEKMLDNSLHFQATTFAHYWLENTGETGFKWHILPNRSQLAPINNMQLIDFDQDGFTDLLVQGGLYDAEVETPRADASVGLLLRNKEGNGFEVVPPKVSGVFLKGNIKSMKSMELKGVNGFVIAKNNEGVEFMSKPNITLPLKVN